MLSGATERSISRGACRRLGRRRRRPRRSNSFARRISPATPD